MKQLYPNKLDNLDETGTFLERHRIIKLTREETDNLNRPITAEKIKLVKKKTHKKTTPKEKFRTR